MSSNEWKEVNLGCLCDFNKASYSTNESWDYVNYLDTGNITENRIDSIQQIDLSKEKLPSRARRKVDKDDIVYSTVRPIQKHYGIIKNPLDNMLVSTGFSTITANKDIVSPQFVYYYLTQNQIIDELQAIAEQQVSTYPSIKASDIESLKIMLPSLSEQKTIADTLSCLDDMIELNDRINQVLEEIAQAIFKSWFIDFEFPNEDGEPYKSSGGEMVDSELGEIPKGWRTGCVNEICKVIYGAPFKSSLFNNVKDGWPLIRIRDLKTYNPQFYTNEHNPRTEFVQPGDILVGMDAEFRPCIWKGDKGVLNQRVCKFEPRLNEVCRFFIYSIIKPHLEFIEGYKVGTTVSHIGKGDIDKIQLIIPTNKALIMFKNTVEPLYVTIINNCKENRILENIRDTLLPKLMSGEIRVPVEEVV